MSSVVRTYSGFTKAALALLGKEIEFNRKLKKINAQALADRCGISRPTLRNIERGAPSVEIGTVFEAAAIVGVKLFNSSSRQSIDISLNHLNDKIALLPESVRLKTSKKINDAF